MNHLVLLTLILTLISGLIAPLAADDLTGTRDYLSLCLSFREAVVDTLTGIDEQAAALSLQLADPDIRDEDINPLLESLIDANPSVDSVALVSPDGRITHISSGSYESLNGTEVSSRLSCDDQRPFISSQSAYTLPTGLNQTDYPGRDLVWPVRTKQGIGSLVIHIHDTNFGDMVAKKAGLNPDVFAVLMDLDGNVLWCSDYGELNSVPPENVLTEFPTFREVKDLVRYAWTGKTVYDVWNSKGIVRTGAWSAVQVYDQVYRVFVAG